MKSIFLYFKKFKNQIHSIIYAKKKRIPYILKRPKGKVSFYHISAFSYGNAGDALLPIVVRDLLGIKENIRWKESHVHKYVTNSMVRDINRTSALIIGGGGLFLRDSNPNQISGWQWSCPIDMLEKINTPIALMAVGYNRFRNQLDFDPVFRKHLNVLASKSVFIGLRNAGSIENIKEYLDEIHHSKLIFQPCPTTILSHLYPDIIKKNAEKKEEPFIALNCAFDRSLLRYGENIGKILTSIASVVKKLNSLYHIKYYANVPTDDYFLPYLDAFSVKYEKVNLNNISHPIDIIHAYSTPELVIGMRGHSQMIPFGCGTPIFSIISHEKMKWFLNDIGHLEWGVDIKDELFEEKLLESTLSILNNIPKIKEKIAIEKKRLYDISVENVNFLFDKIL